MFVRGKLGSKAFYTLSHATVADTPLLTSSAALLYSGLHKLYTCLTFPRSAGVKSFAGFRPRPPNIYSCQRSWQVFGRLMRRARIRLLSSSTSSSATGMLQTKRNAGLAAKRVTVREILPNLARTVAICFG